MYSQSIGHHTLPFVSFFPEYIVTFRGYYTTSARKGYIVAALGPYDSGWSIVERDNPVKNFPSDFSVIKVS